MLYFPFSSQFNSNVAKNFPTHKISRIEKDNSKFEVKLSNDLDLIFDSNGDFVRVDN
ncbi:PepSY-like domain-containing protein [Moheibacter lacus]|uniref:PepSY-like domain-containing protein n=1 Tax=Moheibacter lacus TaxID=2745851 RepID=UPI003743962B